MSFIRKRNRVDSLVECRSQASPPESIVMNIRLRWDAERPETLAACFSSSCARTITSPSDVTAPGLRTWKKTLKDPLEPPATMASSPMSALNTVNFSSEGRRSRFSTRDTALKFLVS